MAVVIACAHCGSRLKLKDETALGKTVRCPSCEETFSAAPAARPASSTDRSDTVRSDTERSSSERSKSSGRAAKADADSQKSTKKPAEEDARRTSSRKGDVTEARPAKEAAVAKRKAKPAEQKELEDPEDDWNLGSLEELAPRPRSRPAKAPPPVVGKKPKRKKESAPAKKGLRDSDGDYPLWMHRLMMIGSGIVGGMIATGLWAALIAWHGWGAGWFAVLVGTCVGIGVRLGASRLDYGWGPAITAAIIALGSMLVGKVIGTQILLSRFAEEVREENLAMARQMEHENYQIHRIAQEIHENNTDEAAYDWSTAEIGEDDDDFFLDEADAEQLPKFYPPKLWEEASAKWKDLPEEERARRTAETLTEVEELKSGEGSSPRIDLSETPYMFHPFDIIWGIFCVSSAFRIAAGMDDD